MVYVDPLMPWGPTARWPHRYSCHMFADSMEELHAMADRLGLRREWLDVSRQGLAHYDLSSERRREAVALGVREVSREFIVLFMRETCGDWRERARKSGQKGRAPRQ